MYRFNLPLLRIALWSNANSDLNSKADQQGTLKKGEGMLQDIDNFHLNGSCDVHVGHSH